MFFTPSAASREAGKQALQRMYATDRGPGRGDHLVHARGPVRRGLRLGNPRSRPAPAARAIGMPVFVANGDSDPMILPHFSYLLAGLIPQAQVKIYPDSAHGFLFQHHAEFAADVEAFLTGQDKDDHEPRRAEKKGQTWQPKRRRRVNQGTT